ncbi:hypothetical protein [Pararhizobium sp. IMCC21322]|uniref:hypothetical protein n=1 Tax=Pararhizobium sp. IMCC21322 TaxID=3067903 RepID=UPI0027423856|nr:hypothetical protein [Pararhizobium sp. IMCC21322]
MALSAQELIELERLISEYQSRLVCEFDDEKWTAGRSDNKSLLKYEISEKPEADDLKEAIMIAVASRESKGKLVAPNPDDHNAGSHCKGHQCRIRKTAYGELTKQLTSASQSIEAAQNFDEIYKIVDKEARHVHGVGALMTYDVAQRIALWRGKIITRNSYIYTLHH